MRNDDQLKAGLDKIYRILLAEDDEDDFYIFNHAMSLLLGPVQILHTSNGVMLSTMIQSPIHPDVIFLDINMPYKSGITCLKEIRCNRTFDKTRVVIYSTSGRKREIDTCYELGANFYLVKPTSFALTKLQLRDLLQNDFFKLNEQPPREKFFMDYQNTKQVELQNKLVHGENSLMLF